MIFLNRHKFKLLCKAAALFGTLCVPCLQSGRTAAATNPNQNHPDLPKTRAVEPILLPMGVADSAGEIGYIQSPEPFISQLNLSTGEGAWMSAYADRPLIPISGMRLAAQSIESANTICVVILDSARKGIRIFKSEPIVFPEWVNVIDGYGHSFHLSVKTRGGDLLLFWEAHAWYAGGAAPPPEVEARARKNALGGFRVNLTSGHVETLPDGKDPDEPASSLLPGLSAVTSQQYWTGSTWETKPFIIGNELKALVQDTAGDQQTLSLKSWDLATGKLLSATTLITGRALWPQVTLNGGALLVRHAVAKETLPPGEDAWSIFSLQTGACLAKLPVSSFSGEVSVLNGRLYTVTSGKPQSFMHIDFVQQVIQRSLRAIDLKTGAVLWERPVAGKLILPPLP
ncbi:MAG: hypothetical protein M3Y56_10725 [Armatimonadota bacterium]|nr:hypothetical protein [Armatimonadota bacterium]